MEPGMTSCRCGNPECDRIECLVCGASDCKWPGACQGRCSECGMAARPNVEEYLRDRGEFDQFCSEGCQTTATQRADESGLIIRMSEISPGRANELLGEAAPGGKLALRGIKWGGLS